MSFSELGLNETFAATITAAGYENPTELQKQLIPLMTAHKSVIVWTQSASGKTGAFLIPAIDYVLNNPLEEHRHARVLILTSRRDRVNQINYTIKRLLGDGQQIRSGFIVSGRPYQPQMRLLRRPLDLMIATPSRLNDLVDNNKADFSKLELLIIDDLSAIFHKGLHGLINKILSERSCACPIVAFVRKEGDIATYARTILAGAEELEIEDERNPLLQIPQVVHLADDYTHKIALMDHLLDEFAGEPTVIFTTTHKVAKALAESLSNHGHSATVAADVPANERNGKINAVLIYTDQDGFAAQLCGDEHVINFDLPAKVEDYEARLRDLATATTREESVIAIVLPRERDSLKLIEESLGDSIEQVNLPGLAPLEHTAGSFTPAVRSARSHHNGDGRGQRNQGQGAPVRGNSHQNGTSNGRNTSNQRKHNNQPSSRGHNSEQRPAHERQTTGNTEQRPQRKGPYGRLNGGAQRKRTDAGHGGNEAPRLYHNNLRANTGLRHNNAGTYEIGSWEKTNYTTQQLTGDKSADDKKVVIRYKEKRRIVTQ